MAKRYDNNFDAEGFVENFRAQDGSSASPPAQAETDAATASVIPKQEKRNPSRPSKEKPSDAADEYKAKFTDKSDKPVQQSQPQEAQPAQSQKAESIIGESTIDMKEIRELVKIAVARSVKEEVGKLPGC